jgi:glycosyltransferase involved in cell wall biosynthesis
MATIGLCMIVKNEAGIITRCIESVRRLVDFVMIEDTGSTDGTQDVIRNYLASKGLPGEVIDEPWQDFASNRSSALAHLRKHADIDYALVMDADDLLVYDEGFDAAAFKAGLTKDLYDVGIALGPIRYGRPQICRNRMNFAYRGVLHEFMESPPEETSRDSAVGFHIESGREGARGKAADKYQRDAAVLKKALETERDPFLISRYTFYLAQSYRDSGEREKALEQYLERAELGYWQEEVFVALYYAAKVKEQLGHSQQEVIDAYLRAADALPARAEALHGASQFCRRKSRFEEGFQLAKRGLAVTRPAAGLFIEPWIYDCGLLDELAVNGYWSGHYRESLDASVKLLASPTSSSDQRDRFAANAGFALEKLPRDPRDANLGSLGSESLIKQHPLGSPRPLRSRVIGEPRVLVAILAKQKEPSLPFYLECIEALDYPKSSIVLYINDTDRTEQILSDWIARVGHLYAGVEFDAENVAEPVETFKAHEWNATRFRVLGRIRNTSMRRVLEHGCDFYFVSDVDNFIRPCTLRELTALDLPIVAPLLRSIGPGQFYSNYHAEIDANGYYKECDQYHWLLNRWVRGVLEVPVVNGTYLVRADVLPDLTYEDETARHEYVVFSHSARKAGITQYLDNRQVYGYVTFADDPGAIKGARALLKPDLEAWIAAAADARAPSAPPQARVEKSATTSPGRVEATSPGRVEGSTKSPGLQEVAPTLIGGDPETSSASKNTDLAQGQLAPDATATDENEPKRPRMKLILVCGPWGSGTSVVAGLLERMGAFGLGPYFQTRDPNTPNSYESIAFKETILRYVSQSTLSLIPCAAGAVQSGLRSLQARIEQQEFGPHDLCSAKPIFLKYPPSALVIPELCEVFDTKLIYVTRPLDVIEQTRLRRNWPAYFGAEGAVFIYDQMSAAQQRQSCPIINICYEALLASPMVHASSIARFAGLEPSPSELEGAVSFVRKDNVRSPSGAPTTAPGSGADEVSVSLERPVITVLVIRPPNYVHWEAYREVALTLQHGCAQLGFEAAMTSDVAKIEGQAIIVGAHVISPEQAAMLSDDTIIYNIEHARSNWVESGNNFYLELLRRCKVWDYNEDNTSRLSLLLGKEATFVKLGYVPQLTQIRPHDHQDIDVLFYGSMNARRRTVLDRLRAAGFVAHHAFGVYGSERDDLIARSKIVLNIHHYEPGAFEVVRVSYLLANRKAVVTEANPGEMVDEDLLGGMVAAPYDELHEACAALLADERRRRELEHAGFAAFSARDEAAILKVAVGEPAAKRAR